MQLPKDVVLSKLFIQSSKSHPGVTNKKPLTHGFIWWWYTKLFTASTSIPWFTPGRRLLSPSLIFPRSEVLRFVWKLCCCLMDPHIVWCDTVTKSSLHALIRLHHSYISSSLCTNLFPPITSDEHVVPLHMLEFQEFFLYSHTVNEWKITRKTDKKLKT